MKGLLVFTYRNNVLGDCTNGGKSSIYDKFVLVGDNIPEVFEANENIPALKLEKVNNHYIATPVSLVAAGKWSMFGGNFIHSNDSRFPVNHPIPIHDRVEW